jgi:hypothetical protein
LTHWLYVGALVLLAVGSLLVIGGAFLAEIEEATEREKGN